MSNFWDEFDNAVEEESKGGGGLIALTRVEAGYKVYVANSELPVGKSQADTWFPAGPDKDSRAKAREQAVTFAKALGVREPTSLSVKMTCQREGALSKGVPVTWKDDRDFVEGLWKNKAGEESDGMKVVAPALRKLGLDLPWTKWARIGFAPSPSGRQDKDVNGNPRTALVAYPIEVFESEAVAKANVELNAAANGFNPETYRGADQAHMKKLFDQARVAKKSPETAYAEIAAAYQHELTPEQVKQVMALK